MFSLVAGNIRSYGGCFHWYLGNTRVMVGVFTGSLVIPGVMVGVFTGSLVIPGLWWVFSLVAGNTRGYGGCFHW